MNVRHPANALYARVLRKLNKNTDDFLPEAKLNTSLVNIISIWDVHSSSLLIAVISPDIGC